MGHCYLNYRLASKFGTIWKKNIHFLTDFPKKDPFSKEKIQGNQRQTRKRQQVPSKLDSMGHFLPKLTVGIKTRAKIASFRRKNMFFSPKKITCLSGKSTSQKLLESPYYRSKAQLHVCVFIIVVSLKTWENWDNNPIFD